ncbi:MAG: hypothetical protein AAFY98_06020 [Verrucomicrobiota bacterium]
MNSKFISLFFVIALGVTVFASSDELGGKSLYPELPFASEYRKYAKMLTDILIEKQFAEEDITSREIQNFIFSRMSIADFEKEMITETDFLRRGHTDKKLRETEDYKEELEVARATTQNMAIMVVFCSHTVYSRKIAEPDDLTSHLFVASKDSETDNFISWIEREAKLEEYTGDVETQEGDKLYYYNSPGFAWEMLFGREGFLLVRDNKVIDNHLTTMN